MQFMKICHLLICVIVLNCSGRALSSEPTKEEVWSAEFVLSDHVLHEVIFAHSAYKKSPVGHSKDSLKKLIMTRVFSYWVYIDKTGVSKTENKAIMATHRHLKNTIKEINFTEDEWLYPAGLHELITKLDGTFELNSLMDERYLPFFPPKGMKSRDQYREFVGRFKKWIE